PRAMTDRETYRRPNAVVLDLGMLNAANHAKHAIIGSQDVAFLVLAYPHRRWILLFHTVSASNRDGRVVFAANGSAPATRQYRPTSQGLLTGLGAPSPDIALC